jgi:hypothetical protein
MQNVLKFHNLLLNHSHGCAALIYGRNMLAGKFRIPSLSFLELYTENFF